MPRSSSQATRRGPAGRCGRVPARPPTPGLASRDSASPPATPAPPQRCCHVLRGSPKAGGHPVILLLRLARSGLPKARKAPVPHTVPLLAPLSLPRRVVHPSPLCASGAAESAAGGGTPHIPGSSPAPWPGPTGQGHRQSSRRVRQRERLRPLRWEPVQRARRGLGRAGWTDASSLQPGTPVSRLPWTHSTPPPRPAENRARGANLRLPRLFTTGGREMGHQLNGRPE